MLDRHLLYESCVQSPAQTIPMLRAIHGVSPRTLGEDFCGTAALARAWLDAVPDARAIVVDANAEPLARIAAREGLTVVHGDVVDATDPVAHRADVVHAGNFSIGELHGRAALVRYLAHARARLEPGGVFVCDLYGGENAFTTGCSEREHDLADGTRVRYTWEQRDADPLTGRVVNVMHFAVLDGARPIEELHDAFVYRWRLWGVPELRDALRDAGFAATAVYRRIPDAIDDEGRAYATPIDDPADLDESYDVLVAGRRDGDSGMS